MYICADCTSEKCTNGKALAANVGMFLPAVSEQGHKSGWQKCKQKTTRGLEKRHKLSRNTQFNPSGQGDANRLTVKLTLLN